MSLPPPVAIGQTVIARTKDGAKVAIVVGIYCGTCCPYSVTYDNDGRRGHDTCDVHSVWAVAS